jgi:methyl-accepting chemotaxis protein
LLIETSNGRVGNGSQLATDTFDTLTGIVESVTKATDLVGEIAAASNEQAAGVSQVSQGLTQIDSVTQQNTASAEEVASTAEELSSQALVLQGLLSRFTLAADTGSAYSPQAVEITPPASAAPTPLPADGWGAGNTAEMPSKQIALDDSEFGKY